MPDSAVRKVNDDVLVHWGTKVTDTARITTVSKSDGYYVTNAFDDIPHPTGCFGAWVGFDQVDDPTKAVWIEALLHNDGGGSGE
jgi:hypothetical protein